VARAAPLDLCPACLLTTALSMGDEACPYQVLTPIGADPGAVTYLAQGTARARGYVALKVFEPRDDVDEIVSRYQDWKAPLARVRHPSFAKLLGVGLTEEGRLYLASDFVAGWPLNAIGSHTSIGIGHKVEIARQITEAIAAAHAAGVVHLMLDPSKVKIATTRGLHATILGLGSRLIVEGSEAHREPDLAALARLVHGLGIER
jgi:eukaryotic-like serine/threonine-protein kinase